MTQPTAHGEKGMKPRRWGSGRTTPLPAILRLPVSTSRNKQAVFSVLRVGCRAPALLMDQTWPKGSIPGSSSLSDPIEPGSEDSGI